MIRVAAVADIHYGPDVAGSLKPQFDRLPEVADLFILAGDLTRLGSTEEAAVLTEDLRGAKVPCFAILGNHDYHQNCEQEIAGLLREAGITVLDGDASRITIDEKTVAVVGAKGFGGGFADACATDFGEREIKAFVRHTASIAALLENRLTRARAEADFVVAALHYSPIRDTLEGEKLEIYPFLGSYLLAEAIDKAGADLVVHGHAHGGKEKGATPGGIHVRNVAQPVINQAYQVYCLDALPGKQKVPARQSA